MYFNGTKLRNADNIQPFAKKKKKKLCTFCVKYLYVMITQTKQYTRNIELMKMWVCCAQNLLFHAG